MSGIISVGWMGIGKVFKKVSREEGTVTMSLEVKILPLNCSVLISPISVLRRYSLTLKGFFYFHPKRRGCLSVNSPGDLHDVQTEIKR